MTFVASEAARKELRPRRALAGSSTGLDAAGAQRLAARLQKLYRTKTYGGDKTYAALFATGLKLRREPALAAVRREAHALLEGFDVAAVGAASIDALAAAERVVSWMDWRSSVTPVVAVGRGIADALRVALRSLDFALASGGSFTTAVFVTEQEGRQGIHVEPWPPLRDVICAAPAPAYQLARDAAQELGRDLDPPRRACIAYLFPDEPWGAELLTDATRRSSHDVDFLLSTTAPAAVVRAYVAPDPGLVSAYAFDLASMLPEADAIAILGAALPSLLERPKYGPLLKTPPRFVAQAIACFDSAAAAAALAPYASQPILAPTVLGWFADHPTLGAALEAQSAGKTKLAETVARALGKSVAATSDAGPKAKTAAPAEVPAVLRDAPWRTRPAGKPLVVRGLALRGQGRERVELATVPPRFEDAMRWPVREMTKVELAGWRRRVEKDEYAHADYEHEQAKGGPRGGWEYLRVPVGEALWAWNEHDAYLVQGAVQFVAEHGTKAIPGFLRRDWVSWLAYDTDADWLGAVTAYVSPRVAPLLARAATYKRARARSLAWMLAHPDVAARGLVPGAVGEEGEARRAAEAALVYMGQKGQARAVRAAAKVYGAAASAAIAALLGRDPLAIGAGTPRPPAFLRRERLPRVLTRKGAALGDGARGALLEMLQIAPLDPSYPGVALLAEACDPASLAAFAVELLEQWVLGDAPGRHEWMLAAVVHFPSEAGTRRVAAMAREWARKNAAKATRACGALCRLGSDLALLHLAHVAETTCFAALRKTAASLVAEAAEARGLSEDELGDRTVPDLGLGPDGTITLSYGARSFVVSFDERLAPVVRDHRTLPRPTRDDDAAAVRDARARWDTLRADLAHTADRQVRRLERALVTSRAWTAEAFVERLARHPLLGHLARRLVWVATPPRGASHSFRVAEDGSFAAERDDAFELPRQATVRLAHPARDRLDRWAQLFGDYAIIQPFAQLGREMFTPSRAEARAKSLTRTAGAKAKAARLHGTLEARGWRRDDAGHVTAYERTAQGSAGVALTVRLPIAPGIAMESLRDAPEQETGAATVHRQGGREPLAFGVLDAVPFSELVRDAEAVRALR